MAILNIYQTIYFEQLIIVESQSPQTKADKKLHSFNLSSVFYIPIDTHSSKTAANKRIVR